MSCGKSQFQIRISSTEWNKIVSPIIKRLKDWQQQNTMTTFSASANMFLRFCPLTCKLFLANFTCTEWRWCNFRQVLWSPQLIKSLFFHCGLIQVPLYLLCSSIVQYAKNNGRKPLLFDARVGAYLKYVEDMQKSDRDAHRILHLVKRRFVDFLCENNFTSSMETQTPLHLLGHNYCVFSGWI